jgi:phage terminase Nu1 subunit (DNA packaging protein)
VEVLTLKAVGKFFKVKPDTITEWRKKGCPHLAKKPYNIEAIGQWRLTNFKDGEAVPVPNDPEADSLGLRKLRADVLKAEASAELERFKVAARTGKLIDSEDVAEIVERQSHAFRQELLAAPKQSCHYFVGLETVEQAEAALRELVYKILGRLAFIPEETETNEEPLD